MYPLIGMNLLPQHGDSRVGGHSGIERIPPLPGCATSMCWMTVEFHPQLQARDELNSSHACDAGRNDVSTCRMHHDCRGRFIFERSSFKKLDLAATTFFSWGTDEDYLAREIMLM